MRSLMLKTWLTLYRVLAAFMLYGMLIALTSYGFNMGFYLINSHWVAPTLISPSNDKILTLTSQLVASQQALDTLAVQTDNLSLTRAEQIARRKTLQDLNARVLAALDRSQKIDTETGAQLNALADRKVKDADRMQKTVEEIEKLRDGLEHDRKAGLITNSEAIAQEAALVQMKNSATDSQVSVVVLRDNARQKTTPELTQVDTMSKVVELQAEITQLEASIQTEEQQIKSNQSQMATIQKAVSSTQDSPYFVVSKASKPMAFAFVPYDNQDAATVGTAVYDCYLSMIFCRQTGTVERVFNEEERVTNPIFRTDMRGFLVSLNLTNPRAVKSKTLFLGRKPLLF
jgi:hypothetical protein